MTDYRSETGKDEHGLDDEADEEELTEAQREARERQDETQRKQDIEHESPEREGDATEITNPDHHRDEKPYNS